MGAVSRQVAGVDASGSGTSADLRGGAEKLVVRGRFMAISAVGLLL